MERVVRQVLISRQQITGRMRNWATVGGAVKLGEGGQRGIVGYGFWMEKGAGEGDREGVE